MLTLALGLALFLGIHLLPVTAVVCAKRSPRGSATNRYQAACSRSSRSPDSY